MNSKLKVFILIVGHLSGFAGYHYLAKAPAGNLGTDEDTAIIIRKGQTLTSAAIQLEEKSIVGNSTLLIRIVSLIGSASDVKAGQYDFAEDRSYWAVARLLLKGSNSPIKITLPEGLTYYQMAGRVQRGLEVDSVAFVRACRDSSIIAGYGVKAKDLEGYLFPDTYYFYYGTGAPAIVSSMVGRFFDVFNDSMKMLAAKVGLTVHEVVTLASLVEKESGWVEERARISAVFHNRLRLGMRLQCDPTVIYAIPNLNRPLRLRDLKVDSPYNTYRHYGLPPGPIANPGRKSLEAAVRPGDEPYLYFVASGEGGHLFAKTNRQHNNNRIKVKRAQKSRQ